MSYLHAVGSSTGPAHAGGQDRLVSYRILRPTDTSADARWVRYYYGGENAALTPMLKIVNETSATGGVAQFWDFECVPDRRIAKLWLTELHCTVDESGCTGEIGSPVPRLFEAYGYDAAGRRVARLNTARGDVPTADCSLATAHDYDGDQVWVERHPDHHVASYLYGPAGPAARTLLNGSGEGLCVQWLLSDGVGNTSGAVDSAGNIVLQHFDAFGVPLDRIALATTNPPTTQAACAARSCELCNGLNDPGSRGRAATGPLGYHGQEGYATNCDDPDRLAPLDTANPQYEGYDSTWPAGYEDRSTGILHVGARDYEPAVGRFLQPDPVEVGPESLAGLLNRWVYCADDPVNFSDPSGEFPWLIVIGAAILVGAIVGYFIDGARGAIIGALGAAAIMIAAWGFAEAVLGGGAAASGAITFGGGTAIKSLNDVVGRMAFDCNGVIGKVLDYMRLPGTGEIFLIIQTASDRIRHVPISVIRGFS